MTVTFGFYNSVAGDRRYDAEQMGAIFDGIINDGVYAAIGTAFRVLAAGGLNLTVGEGRAWFNQTWIYNDALLPMVAPASNGSLARWDAVVIRIDKSQAVRANSIVYIQGTAAASPVRPTMANTATVREYPVAYILRPAGSSGITQSNITYNVGASNCRFVTGPLQVVTSAVFTAQWEAQWAQWMADRNTQADTWYNTSTAEFNAWFDGLQDLLSTSTEASVIQSLSVLTNQFNASVYTNARTHSTIFRGANLGTTFTQAQRDAISNGTFDNLWLGDYWTIDDVIYRIADINYWRGFGGATSPSLRTRNHLVVVPDQSTGSGTMNAQNTSAGGYLNSRMRTTGLYGMRDLYRTRFGTSYVLARREYFTSEVVGDPIAWTIATSYVDLMSETMVFGSRLDGKAEGSSFSVRQLKLFEIAPEFIVDPSATYWLNTVASSTAFRAIDTTGYINGRSATSSAGVRACFALGV